MRIVVTLAAMLALSCGAFAGDGLPAGLFQGPTTPAVTARGESDTSVYHLQHAHAHQLIDRVKSLVAQLAACAADDDVAALPKALVLLPTTSDDTIIAICPKAHAALVKHAIKSCDSLKQYAVKVQLFEVTDSGKTIPVGGPHLLIGREGNVQCATEDESVSVNFKVDAQLVDANTEIPPAACEDEAAAIMGSQASAAGAAGHCHLECPPPIGEMAVETESDTASGSCGGCATCPACKTGTCTGDCCKAGCSNGQTCTASSCKCLGFCGTGAKQSHETTSYEETPTQCPASQSGRRLSVGFGFGPGGPGLHLVGPIVWFNKGDEPRCAPCDAQNEIADSDDGHDGESCNVVPPAPADASEQTGQLCVDPDGRASIAAPALVPDASGYASPDGVRPWINFGVNLSPAGLVVKQTQAAEQCPSTCTDGCPASTANESEVPASVNAPCSCEQPEESQQAPAAEPPALLTLSQHKDPSTGLPATPHWQEEILKAFRGRRLSELFEPQAAPPSALGRLLAEFPKHGPSSATGSGGHSLTIVDLPDRVRIFESDGPAEVEKLSDAKAPALSTCPNCREEFRAFLEEMFRGSEASEDIAQTSHRDGESKAESARDLPTVTHSKIATVTLCYPLRDLVLCDDEGRPVFDTCTIIDHLESAVAPESWSHPSVSIQLDQQSVSLVVTQTAEVHQKIADHLRYLRRLQVKQICNLIERLSGDADEAEPSTQTKTATPTAEVDLGPALPVGGK